MTYENGFYEWYIDCAIQGVLYGEASIDQFIEEFYLCAVEQGFIKK
jgi:hypothetical protein